MSYTIFVESMHSLKSTIIKKTNQLRGKFLPENIYVKNVKKM